jgi:hypothetical protein
MHLHAVNHVLSVIAVPGACAVLAVLGVAGRRRSHAAPGQRPAARVASMSPAEERRLLARREQELRQLRALRREFLAGTPRPLDAHERMTLLYIEADISTVQDGIRELRAGRH